MAAIARALSRAFPTNSLEAETLKQLALLCAAGVLVSVLLMTYGLDLSPGLSESVQLHGLQSDECRRFVVRSGILAFAHAAAWAIGASWRKADIR